MDVTLEQKEVLFSRDIYNQIAFDIQNKSYVNIDNITKALNDLVQTFLSQFGIPVHNNIVTLNFDPNVDALGVYSPRKNNITLFANQMKKGNAEFFFNTIHEATHLMQYFIIKNAISRNNVDDLSLQQYKNICSNFYKKKDIIVTDEMLNTFKNFVKKESFFEKDQMRLLIEDVIKYNNKQEFYRLNMSEIMADTFALRELYSFLQKNTVELSQFDKTLDMIARLTRNFRSIESDKKGEVLQKQDKLASLRTRNKCRHILKKSSLPLSIENSAKLTEIFKKELLALAEKTKESCHVYHSSPMLNQNPNDNKNTINQPLYSYADEILSDNQHYEFTTNTTSIDLSK